MIEFGHKLDAALLLPGALLVLVILRWSFRAARGVATPRQRWLGLGLRCLTVALVVIALLDPQRVREVKRYQPAWVALMLDTSRSMEAKAGRLNRLELAQRWVAQELHLPTGFSLTSYGFSSNLLALPNASAAVATGERTAIAESLESLWSLAAAKPPAAVLLISDGNDNSFKNPEEIAKFFGRNRVPIHTLALGAEEEPADIVLEEATANGTMLKVQAGVTVRSSGFSHAKVPLRIAAHGTNVVEKLIELNGASQHVEVEFASTRPGFQTFTAEIAPQPGEWSADNNRLEFGLSVNDSPLRVLYMESSAGTPEYAGVFYLKHALEESPDIKTTTLYCEAAGTPRSRHDQVAYLDPKTGEKVYRLQHSTRGCPRTLEEMLRYHVIIDSDVPKANLSAQQLESMRRFVTEYGGGFAMIGGHTAFGAGGYNETPLDRIIPVEMETERDVVDARFTPVLTGTGWQHPMMNLDPSKNREIWSRLPAFNGFNRVDRAKPGAVVLMEHPLVRTAYGPAVILALQEIGRGRSLAFTSDANGWWGEQFDTLWGEPVDRSKPLSAANCDVRYYRQFWRNAIRWLAANRLQRERDQVHLNLAQARCAPGTEAVASVRVSNLEGNDAADANVTVQVLQDGAALLRLNAPYDSSVRSYSTRFETPGPGRFEVRATATWPDGRSGEDAQLFVCGPSHLEMSDARARPGLLADIARWSGGRALSRGSQSDALVEVLAAGRPATVESRREPLWATWTWLAMVVGLLTLEWVVRRATGLA
jgi:uncharacterized membrane protein